MNEGIVLEYFNLGNPFGLGYAIVINRKGLESSGEKVLEIFPVLSLVRLLLVILLSSIDNCLAVLSQKMGQVGILLFCLYEFFFVRHCRSTKAIDPKDKGVYEAICQFQQDT